MAIYLYPAVFIEERSATVHPIEGVSTSTAGLAAAHAAPAYAPCWSDANSHDPGVSLLEVLAWSSEADRYRLEARATVRFPKP